MTLPAFAAERRAAEQLLLGAQRPPLSIDIHGFISPQNMIAKNRTKTGLN